MKSWSAIRRGQRTSCAARHAAPSTRTQRVGTPAMPIGFSSSRHQRPGVRLFNSRPLDQVRSMVDLLSSGSAEDIVTARQGLSAMSREEADTWDAVRTLGGCQALAFQFKMSSISGNLQQAEAV
eukprot:5185143-Prymnesium_polylepis.2